MEDTIIGQRLDNVDKKLDQLVSVLTTQNHMIKQIDDHETRLRGLESTVKQNSFIASGAIKFAGLVVAGAVGLGFFYLKV